MNRNMSGILLMLLTLLAESGVWSANVLMLHPVVSRSHELMFITIGEALALRGHNVTMVRFKGPTFKSANLIHTIVLQLPFQANESVAYLKEDGTVELPHEILWKLSRNIHTIPMDVVEPVSVACHTLLKPEMLNRFKTGVKYDVAIIDVIYNECGLALAHYLGLPTVGYWPTIHNMGEMFWTSSVQHPAFVPVTMSEFTDRMHFSQRFFNSLWYIGGRLFSYLMMLVYNKSIIERYLPDCPHPADLVGNLSLLMVNSDFNLDFPRPISPNTLYIGCVQCRPPRPLPKDLGDFMESSGEHGVIIFSLGATFSEGGMPLAVVQDIYRAFARCQQKVILKMSHNFPSVQTPPNVRVVEWLPQQDILGHKKTSLFVTHCGMHGVLESLYHGVPMVGIPIFLDQGDVLVRLQIKGVAYGVHKFDITEERLYNAIQTVLNNDSYKQNALKMSSMIRDQPQSVMDRTMYWIEYVIRHRGAEHLKPADWRLSLFQYLLLDVIIAYIVILTSFTFIIYWLTKKMFTKIWTSFKKWTKLLSQSHVEQRKKID